MASKDERNLKPAHKHEHADQHDCNHGHGHEHSHNHGRGHKHSHTHGHSHHGHHHAHMPGNKAGLAIALAITSGIMLLEFVGGLVTNSLALLSDAGHMLSDAGALALSLFAIYIAAKPPSARRSFGFARFEVLAALLNGATLFAIAGFIVWEAAHRVMEPPTVSGGPMMLIAGIGLLANLASAWFLMKKGDVMDNLNVRSAYLHVIGDALGSVGAIAAGLLMYAFGWYIADPIISVIVSLLILRGAWGVTKMAVHILMEGTPHAIDAQEVQRSLLGIEGVLDVHDLHIWTIASGLDSLSCHLLVEDAADGQSILQQAIVCLEEQYGIEHATVQIETSALKHPELKM